MRQNIRSFLKEELERRKTHNESYSLRAFANNLNVSSAQLSQIISGKRPVTPQFISKIADKLALGPTEIRSMMETHLVANKNGEQSFAARQLKEDQFALISDWYHLAILSLTKIKGAKKDTVWIADRLGIKQTIAKESIERLERLGILSKGVQFKQIGGLLNIDSEIPSQAIQKFHKGMLGLSLEKLSIIEPSRRDYSVLIFSGNEKKLARARKIIENCQNEVSELMGSGEHDQVFAISCQLLPLK
jgi:uncharacterized protein (TIGR02147 family)